MARLNSQRSLDCNNYLIAASIVLPYYTSIVSLGQHMGCIHLRLLHHLLPAMDGLWMDREGKMAAARRSHFKNPLRKLYRIILHLHSFRCDDIPLAR